LNFNSEAQNKSFAFDSVQIISKIISRKLGHLHGTVVNGDPHTIVKFIQYIHCCRRKSDFRRVVAV